MGSGPISITSLPPLTMSLWLNQTRFCGVPLNVKDWMYWCAGSLRLYFDDQLLAVAELYSGVLEERRAENVVAADGIDGVEAQCAEHVPGRHLADVLVALQAVGSR